jgi:hypothetical protein
MSNDTSAAWPLADTKLAQELYDLVQQANHYRQRMSYLSRSGSC